MPATTVTTAPNRFFQPALSVDVAGHASGLRSDRVGEVVNDIDDVNQCVGVILLTPKGSDPLRPTFGSNAHLYLDAPFPVAKPQIVREVFEALSAWEPRIGVHDVQVTQQGIAHMRCVVVWQFVGGLERFTASVTLGGQS